MKIKHLLFATCFALLSVYCTRENLGSRTASEGTGTILLSVIPDGITTKATSPDITALSHETRIEKVDIYVFESSGLLNLHHQTDKISEAIPLSVTTGDKEIWAVLNGPALGGIIRVSDLKEAIISLQDNQATPSGGTFTMAGSNTCKVTASGTAACNITAERFVARVRLTKVDVQLPVSYGSVTFPYIMLTNVVADQRLDGGKGQGVWYNKKGRTESGAIIDGTSSAKAQAEAVTFYAWNKHVNNNTTVDLTGEPMYFYGFDNPATQDKTDAYGAFLEEPTRLVVAATISGRTYYYPVTIPGLARNKAYEVQLTITGLGSDDPDVIPQRGDASATVIVKSWGEGAVINETI